MTFSRQRAVSDGTLVALDISLKYFKREDLSVLLDGVVTTDWSWVGSMNRIQFPSPIPNLVEVTIVRTTQRDKVIHEFAKGAKFVNTSVDQDFLQMLYLAQEYTEGQGFTDIFNDIDMHGFQLTNLGRATLPGNAVPLSQYQEDLGNLPVVSARADAAYALAAQVGNGLAATIAKSAYVFNSVAAAMALTDPSVPAVRTLGYYSPGDRGGALYYIDRSSSAASDGGSVHILPNGWRMILINEGPVACRLFGAKGDGVTDDWDALQRWATYLVTRSYLEQVAGYWQRGRYLVSKPVEFATGDFLPNMYSDGPGNVRILALGSGGVLFTPTGGSGQNIGVKWEGIAIEGNGSNYGTRNDGLCYFNLYNWHFYNVSKGMWAVNLKAGGFTEGWQGHGCYFHTNVKTWIEYDRVAGTDSCRGTGLVDFRGNCGPTSTPVVIQNGVVAYSAPMGGHIWIYNPNTVFITNNSTQCPMYGDINIESQIGSGAKVTLGGGTGAYIFHQGTLTSWGFARGNMRMGKMLRVREYANVPGVGQMFVPDFTSDTLASSVVGETFTIPVTMGVESPYLEPSAIATIGVRAPGVYWQGVYLITPGATANIMNATKLVDNLITNTAGVGAAIVSQGNMYHFNVRIPSLPVGAVLTYTINYNHALLPR